MRGFPTVLCYHAVTDGWPSPIAVTPRFFEWQLRSLLRAGWRAIAEEEVRHGRGRLFHVTFDDAFRSVETHALPVLERLGVPCTIFASTAYADTGAPLAVPELSEDVARFPGELDTLDWDGLRRLQDRGVGIGSHTVSHPHLTLLSDAEIAVELSDSRERLEAELGRPCRSVAYPYGHDDGRVHDAARRAGYELGWRLPGTREAADPLALPRVGGQRARPACSVRAQGAGSSGHLTRAWLSAAPILSSRGKSC